MRELLLVLALLACTTSATSASYTDYNLTVNSVDKDFCDSTKQLSGYFKIMGSKSKNYFYWFFESRGSPSTDPLIIWLTGGPGCSSTLALLLENGPCSVNDDLSLRRNPYSWNERANVMWIDQPVGVGFSYGDKSEYDTSEKEVGDDMYHFLQEFLQAKPEYQKLPFYVFGESYAGHYVPAIAHRIFQGNQQKEGPLEINLKGFGIGNGLTDPEVQYKYYPDMAYNNTYGVKAVSYPVYVAMKAAVPPCVGMIDACQTTKAACLAAQTFCNAALVAPYTMSGLNVYDIRSKCQHWPMCYDFSHIEKFLRLESTLRKLHVSPKSAKWQSCNMEVHAGFSFDWMKNFQQLVPPMLEAGIRGLVYAGDADFIVNWMGCKAWTLQLPWSQHDEFLAAEDKDWIVDGQKAGRIRQVGPFAFQQVYEAGHMVPLDQPKHALALLKAFTQVSEEHEEKDQNELQKQLMDREVKVKDESVMSVM
ncbi:serine protease family [Plasmopara halstedii]|uniref:Carboxypeptidase n=1 Tax=Plasmopara halstedii TaxID=4781 RepID=A0A0P1B326_PLAHL|nr:serine protease family [Plasmopara halstedii]CEG48455.1 serine protease family [Plasmopara halstedii]|eukprot:XP_024584824.1 serine protease family [Plasmopara halstedii]